MAPNYFLAHHHERRPLKRLQSLPTKAIVERAKQMCEQLHLDTRGLAKLAGIEQSLLRRLLRGEIEPGEQMLRQLHTALDAIGNALLEQERRGEICTHCGRKGHWGRDCPKIAAVMRGRQGVR